MRSEGYSTWVCVCVCLSVTRHLTSRVFVRLTNDATYLTGNEGQKLCAVFSEKCSVVELQPSSIVRLMRSLPFFFAAENAIIPRVFPSGSTDRQSCACADLDHTTPDRTPMIDCGNWEAVHRKHLKEGMHAAS